MIRRKKKLFFSVAVLVLLPVAVFQFAVWLVPYPGLAKTVESTWIYDRDGAPLGAFASATGEWSLPLTDREISPHLLDAIVAVEDQRFYQHGGVDWQSAAGAAWEDVFHLSLHRGASTITMQLQHLRQPRARSIWGKFLQAVRACQIERSTGKREILVEYLNRAPFGGNLVGVGAASWRYFGKPCANLSLGQAALLAGLPQSPNRFRPDRHSQAARARRDHVLERMEATGTITRAQRLAAAAEPVDATWHSLPQDAVDTGLTPTLMRWASHGAGRTIYSTIDSKAQAQVMRWADDQLRQLRASNVNAAAVVVLDNKTGACLSLMSRNHDQAVDSGSVDLTVAARSSGSALKPLIYAAAFDAGICTPQTLLDDSPTAWSGYEPGNYDHQFDGPLPAAEALSLSRNIPALFVLSKVGVPRTVELMRGCGLQTLARTPDRYGLSLAIGGAEVTPIELAGAYADLARLGKVLPIRQCSTDLPQPACKANVLRRSACLAVLNSLADPERTRRVWPDAMSLAPAWKTGTSSGHRDAWCAAVSVRRTVVVWLGNVSGEGSDALVGQDAAAPLALHLLTVLDPGGTGFAPPESFLAKTAAPPQRESALALISPVHKQTILHDPSLPADHQRFPLRARGLDSDAKLWWFIDGTCLGSGNCGEPFWWDPTPGQHEVRVSDETGTARIATILVKAGLGQ